jgi:hypothetical protein
MSLADQYNIVKTTNFNTTGFQSFRLLYPLEDQLNSHIQKSVSNTKGIKALQVFFNTDKSEDNFVELSMY